jgi:hypothetical protein
MQDDPLFTRLNLALHTAKAAVAADKAGDYTLAVTRYREVANALETEAPNAPQENRPAFFEKANRYKSRIQILERSLATGSTLDKAISASRPRGYTIGTSAPDLVVFEEEEISLGGKLPDAIPVSPTIKPYWLMKNLAATISTGAFLSPRIYISKAVWQQTGAKFKAIDAKVQSLVSVIEVLPKISALDLNNKDLISKNLDEFLGLLENLRDMLSKHLAFIKASGGMSLSKIVRGAGLLKAGLSGGHTDSAYPQLLLQTFQKSAFLENWLVHFERAGPKDIYDQLKRISEFYYSVLLAFAVRDFNMLLSRYIKGCRYNFIKEVPLQE